MSYYTHFTLTHNVPEDNLETLRSVLKVFFVSSLLAPRCIEQQWHTHESDMRKVSETFPDATFTLEGIGQFEGDHWRKKFVNGKMAEVSVRAIWDDFPPLT
jgi:hypothetical protein